jgi:MFS family permease
MPIKPPRTRTTGRLAGMARALRHRNFRLFVYGQSISLIGTWMQRVALGWLVYRVTDSPLLLGVVGFAGQFPTFLLAPFAGVLADRWNRHRMLLITQTIALVQALILAVLVLAGTIQIGEIVALSVLLGLINAFDMPTRQSFLVQLIGERRDLGNAIALNSSIVNAARLLGPTVAGLLIAWVGEGFCFLVNALSYGAVIASLTAMRIAKTAKTRAHPSVVHQLREGFRYAWDAEPIRAILLLLSLVSLVGMPYTVLMPVFARDVLHGGPDAFGYLMGGAGVGALAGALYLASRNSVLGLGRLVPLAAALFGGGLMAFSASALLPLSLLLITFTGFGQLVLMASGNTLLQTIVDEDKRGRVMSFYTMAFFGTAPLGSLLAGALAERIGANTTLFLGGVVCLAAAAVFTRALPRLRAQVRPIYVRQGILPAVATGLQQATELALPEDDVRAGPGRT